MKYFYRYKWLLFLLLPFLCFFFPSSVSAQGQCNSSDPRWEVGVFVRDDQGRTWGGNNDGCSQGRVGVQLQRIAGSGNWIDTNAGIAWRCGGGNGFGGGFNVRTFKCNNLGPSNRMRMRLVLPAPYLCGSTTWVYENRTTGADLLTGTGCDIDIYVPGGMVDYTNVVNVTMRANFPDPNRLSPPTCNTNETLTIRWNGVAGATDYAWRLDNLISGWRVDTADPGTTDSGGLTAATQATIPLRYAQNYRWTVTSRNAALQGPLPSSWSANLSCQVPEPTGRTFTCNDNQTVTLSWNAVAQAATYVPRLNRIANPEDWRNLAAGDTGANAPGIPALSATYPIVYGRSYSWAVSSFSASNVNSAHTWSAPFTCAGVNITTRSSGGAAVDVRGMGYTYNACGNTRTCTLGTSQNSNIGSFRAIAGWQGGAGIALNSNQRIIGISPVPAGGAAVIRNPNNPSSAAWQDQVTWNNYWWNPYPNTAGYSVNYVIATITPVLGCGTSTTLLPAGPQRVNTAITGRLNGVNNTTTGCNFLINGTSEDTGTATGTPRNCVMNGTVNAGNLTYNLRATNGASSISCLSVPYCGDSTAPPIPGNRALTCRWTGTNGLGTNLYTVDYRYTAVTDPTCVGINSTPYRAQLSTSNNVNANGDFISVGNTDGGWQAGAVGLVSNMSNQPEGTTIFAHVKSRDGLDNQSAWSARTPAAPLVNRIALNSTNCTGVPPTPTFTPTPTPAYWFKLRDSSFNRVSTATTVQVPNNPLRFNNNDAADPAPAAAQLIIGNNGLIAGTSPNLSTTGGGVYSTSGANKNNYPVTNPHIQSATTLNLFRDSLRATKNFRDVTVATITAPTDITTNRVNIRTGNLTINTNQALPTGPYVIYVDGNVYLNVAGGQTVFNAGNQSIAIIARGTIFINRTITEANGIFAASNISLVDQSWVAPQRTSLKINGNLISNTNVNTEIRTTTDARSPSLFVVFRPQMYLDLLPLLSTVVQEGRQLE